MHLFSNNFRNHNTRRTLLLIFLMLFLFCFATNTALAKILSIKGDRVNSRSEPNQKSRVLFEYGNGFPVEIIKQQGSWFLTKDFEGDTGWVHKSRLEKVKQVIVKANQSQNSTINVRSNPGLGGSVVANAHYGVVFKVLEQRGAWVHVQHESGIKGWINADLLWGI